MKAAVMYHRFGVDVFDNETANFVGGFGLDKLEDGPETIARILAEILKNLGVEVELKEEK
jgi:hypothetical protein